MANEKSIEEKKNKTNGGLKRKLKTMTIVPVILTGIVVTVLSYYVFLYTTQKEVRRNLSNAIEAVAMYYSNVYSGNYSGEKAGDRYYLYKGDTEISSTTSVLDEFKERTGVDYTIFYFDVRIVTTITDKNGERVVYTFANNAVSDAVINKKQEMFYNDIDINGIKYYAMYKPLYNNNGETIGMLFAGKPTSEVERENKGAIMFIPLITIIMTIVASLISMAPAKNLVDAIKKEEKFLDEIAKGNLNTEIDPSIIKRNDELGEMGRFSRSVQKFIRDMIERDTLTHLYTRRIGQSKIDYVQHQLNNAGVKYCVCMGDIDFFKKVNDTYGHDAGDIVLRDIANIFNENMLGRGFTIRWGGEEFLIIFEDADLEKAYKILSGIREKVLLHEMEYNDQILKVTMTFGLTAGDNRHIDDIVKDADNLLYYGKQNGRNQIVTSDDYKKMMDVEGLDEIKEKEDK